MTAPGIRASHPQRDSRARAHATPNADRIDAHLAFLDELRRRNERAARKRRELADRIRAEEAARAALRRGTP